MPVVVGVAVVAVLDTVELTEDVTVLVTVVPNVEDTVDETDDETDDDELLWEEPPRLFVFRSDMREGALVSGEPGGMMSGKEFRSFIICVDS